VPAAVRFAFAHIGAAQDSLQTPPQQVRKLSSWSSNLKNELIAQPTFSFQCRQLITFVVRPDTIV
jgi:hypothetical protein